MEYTKPKINRLRMGASGNGALRVGFPSGSVTDFVALRVAMIENVTAITPYGCRGQELRTAYAIGDEGSRDGL